tara:strand:+ start:533 stop:1261 length:729 start_codon:yes stop_codon:yes gene_type:complete
MAITLQDESKVIEFLGGNTSPTPVIIGKGGMFAVANYTEGDDVQLYKRDLLAVNEDYLSSPNTEVITSISDLNVRVKVSDVLALGTQSFISVGNTALGAGRIFFGLFGGGGAVYVEAIDVNNVTVIGQVVGTYTLGELQDIEFSIISSKVYADGLEIFDLSGFNSEVFNIDMTKPYAVGSLAYIRSRLLSATIENYSVNGEEFGLNESSGALITGSLGTTGMCITSNASPTYIDDVMIQPIN